MSSAMRLPACITRRQWLFASMSAVTLAGCSSGPVPRDAFYRLGTPAAPPVRAGGPVKGTLEIPPFRAAGIVNERALLYRDGPNHLEQYSYHAWVEPPAVLLQQALIDVLRKAQAFDNVVSPEMRLDRDYELMGDLRQWEHVRDQKVAAIEIEISIRRVADNQQVLLKTYSATEPAQGEGIDAVVAAFTHGVDVIYAQLIGDLAAIPPAPAAAPKPR